MDLAKHKFQVHGFSASGDCLQRLTLSRGQFDSLFSHAPSRDCLVVMEACSSSNYWGRRLQLLGYRVKRVPAQFVDKQRIGNKNDGNDADAIFAVHQDRRVRPVPVKTVAQQDLCAQHRLRELLVSQRTQLLNQARSLLAERGQIAAQGRRALGALIQQVREVETNPEVTADVLELLGQITCQVEGIDAQIQRVEARLKTASRTSPLIQHVQSIHGVDLITATAMVAEYGANLSPFADARQFAASLGLTPSEHASGQHRRLGGISRRGNPYLRTLLVQGAQAVLRHCQRREDAISQVARRLLESKRRTVAVVAIANRLARIIYAVIKQNTPYRAQPQQA
ncbi:IS110 family transposase [Pseudomonas sp. CAU 1711]|uniref:IS110 family transposase n=1 Tax=Pseudomonas sp. CAU 1711 TaxID=3140356 RepID=UPI0032609BEE